MKLWPDGRTGSLCPIPTASARSRSTPRAGCSRSNGAAPIRVSRMTATTPPRRRARPRAQGAGRQIRRRHDPRPAQRCRSRPPRRRLFTTQGGVGRVAADGTVTTIADGNGLFTNGVALSPDGKTLYVTNRTSILAFDVGPDWHRDTGATSSRWRTTRRASAATAWRSTALAGSTSPAMRAST